MCLSRQKFCHDRHTFVVAKDMFVMTKMVLVAAPANDKSLSEKLMMIFPIIDTVDDHFQITISDKLMMTCPIVDTG